MIHIFARRSKPPTVLVMMGSTRAGRLCPKIAAWVVSVAREAADLNYELVDLADWHLPMNDEPNIPEIGGYTQKHTRAWSEKVAGASAILFVTPQYNWGYPAPLKNALDHLYKEWEGKPAAIVTYGGHGGTKCAAQLRQVTEALEMRSVATMPAITLTEDMIRDGRVDPGKDFVAYEGAIRQMATELAALLEAPVS